MEILIKFEILSNLIHFWLPLYATVFAIYFDIWLLLESGTVITQKCHAVDTAHKMAGIYKYVLKHYQVILIDYERYHA